MPDNLRLPADWEPDRANLDRAVIGDRLTADNTAISNAEVSLYRNHIAVFGPKGSGTTNVTNVIIANAVARDCITWIIDLDGGDVRRWFAPILAGKRVRPGPDWVATTHEDALIMIEQAAKLSSLRAAGRAADLDEIPAEELDRSSARQIVLVIASGAEQLGINPDAPAGEATQKAGEELVRIARENQPDGAGGGVNLVLNVKRLADLGWLFEHMTTVIGCGAVPEDEAKIAFGELPHGYLPKAGWAIASAGNTTYKVHPYWISPARIAELAQIYGGMTRPTLDDDEADQLGPNYLYRWQRTMHLLFHGLGVRTPDHLKNYGLPIPPGDLSRATRRQLEFALLHSPSANSEGQQAAAHLLLHACGAKLLTSGPVRKALAVEDGVLYIRWDLIKEAARTFETGLVLQHEEHPDASLVLRIAAHLATGGLTTRNADTLIDALLGVAGDDDQGPEGEQE